MFFVGILNATTKSSKTWRMLYPFIPTCNKSSDHFTFGSMCVYFFFLSELIRFSSFLCSQYWEPTHTHTQRQHCSQFSVCKTWKLMAGKTRFLSIPCLLCENKITQARNKCFNSLASHMIFSVLFSLASSFFKLFFFFASLEISFSFVKAKKKNVKSRKKIEFEKEEA